MNTFKYATEEHAENFYTNIMHEHDVESPAEYIKNTPEIMQLVYSRDVPCKDILVVAEIFLHIFEEAEDYEICATMLKTWPELKK